MHIDTKLKTKNSLKWIKLQDNKIFSKSFFTQPKLFSYKIRKISLHRQVNFLKKRPIANLATKAHTVELNIFFCQTVNHVNGEIALYRIII